MVDSYHPYYFKPTEEIDVVVAQLLTSLFFCSIFLATIASIVDSFVTRTIEWIWPRTESFFMGRHGFILVDRKYYLTLTVLYELATLMGLLPSLSEGPYVVTFAVMHIFVGINLLLEPAPITKSAGIQSSEQVQPTSPVQSPKSPQPSEQTNSTATTATTALPASSKPATNESTENNQPVESPKPLQPQKRTNTFDFATSTALPSPPSPKVEESTDIKWRLGEE